VSDVLDTLTLGIPEFLINRMFLGVFENHAENAWLSEGLQNKIAMFSKMAKRF
jgi:hypothetical protein